MDSKFRVFITRKKYGKDGFAWYPTFFEDFSSEFGAKLFALMFSYISGVKIEIHLIYHVK